jgi:hypothetical protein
MINGTADAARRRTTRVFPFYSAKKQEHDNPGKPGPSRARAHPELRQWQNLLLLYGFNFMINK